MPPSLLEAVTNFLERHISASLVAAGSQLTVSSRRSLRWLATREP